jgi:GT2 family glycosyltransferase
MNGQRKIVVLGMMTKIPVAGVVWQTMHYLLGLRRLGLEPYYFEAHARTPSMLMRSEADDSALLAAGFIDRAMRRFDLGDRWSYQALHDDGRYLGITESEVAQVLDEAELILNLHGGTVPREEHRRTGRLVYVETDPVQLQAELADGVPETLEFLESHCAFFSFGENWGAPDCGLPVTERFDFRATRQPVCLDLWPVRSDTPAPRFTTVGNWRQAWRDVALQGRVLSWSKHHEWAKVLDLPRRTGRRFELALSGYEPKDAERLHAAGWEVRDALPLSGDVDRYQGYISRSFAELTVAKEQNVVLRSGWFSDRSATYLAAGRPVITQETGFSNVLPVGLGLQGFDDLDEAAAAVERVCSDYAAARREAREVARECFAAEVVLGNMLEHVGVSLPGRSPRASVLVDDLRLDPVSRRPLRLDPSTERRVLGAPIPFGPGPARGADATIVVVTHEGLALTRLCLESVLADRGVGFELVVVDNGSLDGTRSYLRTLARRFDCVRVILNDENRGFPAACNQGLAEARGELLVLLNNDTIVPAGWLGRLGAAAADPSVGLLGPVTNRIGNEAEVPVSYRTYGEFREVAAERARTASGEASPLPMPAMFCLAMRREVHERLGPVDEQFGLGMLEDDDYAERAREAGLNSICVEGVLVHHFGEGSFGTLFADGRHGALLERNRERFERKWGRPWQPYGRRLGGDYLELRDRVRVLVGAALPAPGPALVVSRGDEELIAFEGREGWHFPQSPDGDYAGRHPADDGEAIAELERLRAQGAAFFVVPATSFWWLDHYRSLRSHLAARYQEIVRDDACRIYSLGGER